MQKIIEKIYMGKFYSAEQIAPILQNFHEKWGKSKENIIIFSERLPNEIKPLFEAVMIDKLEIATLEQVQQNIL